MTIADDTFGARLHNGHALVVGASQGIGLGFVKHLLMDPQVSGSMAPIVKSRRRGDYWHWQTTLNWYAYL